MRLEVVKARKTQLLLVAALEPDIVAGTPLATMRSLATRECIDLGQEFLRVGDNLYRSGVRRKSAAEFRCAIGRYYYAMFQSARALAFIDSGGDDNNDHQKLPGQLPQALANRNRLANDLKTARNTRNRADYDPYPTAPIDWQPIALDLKKSAASFVAACDSYLKAMGI